MHEENTDRGRCKDGQNVRAQQEPWRLLPDTEYINRTKSDHSEIISLLWSLEGSFFLLVFQKHAAGTQKMWYNLSID